MTKSSWGTKRKCPACGAAFYDLNQSPAACPKCGGKFDPSVVTRTKRKTVKRTAPEESIMLQSAASVAKRSVLPGKKQKKESDEDDVGEGIGELIEIDDADDIENLHELSELEEMEESSVNEDDVDEEALIEDLDTGDNAIVGSVEDEEAIAYVKEVGEDEQGMGAKKRKGKK